MKMSPSEQESIVALLTRIYKDIIVIEEEFKLLAGENDFRPRIEHFHDAVRAFTSRDPQHPVDDKRLSIEMLAYDLSCLRYIQAMPLSSFKPQGAMLSPGTDIIKKDKGLVVAPRRPDRAMRERISELYQHYAVLFAALLKPIADRDYRDRIDTINQDVQDVHDLVTQLEALLKGSGSIDKVAASVQHLEEDGLRVELLNFLQQQKHKKKENLKKLIAFLKEHSAKKDKEISNIDAVHMNYVLAQLSIFEASKDMIKKLAAQGMNLVGKFVEEAIAQSRREMGR